MKKANVFVKLGGSFITDKAVAYRMLGSRIVSAARMIRKALDRAAKRKGGLSLVLGHGAGSFGHVEGVKYGAVKGVHPDYGWEGMVRIRQTMAKMNSLFLRHCGEGGLSPVTVSPFAVATAKGGAVTRIDVKNISELLRMGQIPLVHGDIVPDTKRGFTIASTEDLLAALSRHLRFDRVVMVSNTGGVLDAKGSVIKLINRRNMDRIAGLLGGSDSPDVTGGMRRKVERLFALVVSGRAGEARIIGCVRKPEDLCRAILGTGGGGTLIKP
ncbi:MAG: isopentenyl phosphate kinase [Elusimicrobiota bacterium]